MKNVYFVLANQAYGKALYLPYVSACLAAYAWSFDEIRAQYRCADFFFRREPIADVLDRMESPAVVAFTCYMWTVEYNKALARAIRERYPECAIIYGGHEIAEEDDLASLYPEADFFIFGEGEIPFKNLLSALASDRDFASIPNTAYASDGKVTVNPREYYRDLDYPSPFLTGYFDAWVRDNPDVEFSVALETNRGCPYQCAYCDWSNERRMRLFPMEKVRAEIEWCSTHKIEYIACADANFGIFERDYEIAQYVVELKRKNGYPFVFNACYAKNSNDNVFRISKLFYDNGVNKAITLAYQTVAEPVLRNINRQNFSLESFSGIVKRFNEHRIPTYPELILGLPGETLQSFKEGMCTLVEAGQHNAMTVYDCQVLRNALLCRAAYREKYGIRSVKVPINYIHASLPDPNDIQEYTEQVIATESMPFEDMIDALMFCTCLQGFHHIGLLKFFAVYVRNELQVSYLEFYDSLVRYIRQADGTFLHQLLGSFRARCCDLSLGEWTYYNPKFGKMGWYYEEGWFMEIAVEYERFWDEILPFLRTFPIPEDVFLQLTAYQKFVVRLVGQTHMRKTFDYDFYTYFKDAVNMCPTPLRKRRMTVKIDVKEPVASWEEYALRVMLYAKKKGATLYTNDKDAVTVLYEDESE